MKKLLLSTLAVLALGAAVQTSQAQANSQNLTNEEKAVFAVGTVLHVVSCHENGTGVIRAVAKGDKTEKAFCVVPVKSS